MSFYGATALRLQPPNLNAKWAKYFSQIIDECQTQDQIDAVYDHWAECIDKDIFKAIPTNFSDIDHRVPPPIREVTNPVAAKRF